LMPKGCAARPGFAPHFDSRAHCTMST
jgi:hypothetical protein